MDLEVSSAYVIQRVAILARCSLKKFAQTIHSFGAGDRDRTGDIQLGKLTFCH